MAALFGSAEVITASIRCWRKLLQPSALMFDRIIRKLSVLVITGAHLFFSPLSGEEASHQNQRLMGNGGVCEESPHLQEENKSQQSPRSLCSSALFSSDSFGIRHPTRTPLVSLFVLFYFTSLAVCIREDKGLSVTPLPSKWGIFYSFTRGLIKPRALIFITPDYSFSKSWCWISVDILTSRCLEAFQDFFV